MRETFIIRQFNRLLLRGWEGADSLSHKKAEFLVCLCFIRAGAEVRYSRGRFPVNRVLILLPASGASSQSIQGPTSRQGDQPGNRGASSLIVSGDFPPNFKIDILQQFLCLLAIAQDASSQGKEQCIGMIVELTKSLLLTLDNSRE